MGIPPPIQLATFSMPDTLILMVLALVVFGPRRLPQIGRQIGKLMYEFRKASNDFKFQMEEELRNAEEADRRKKEEEERQRALTATPPPPQIESPTAHSPESGTPDAASTESPYPHEMTYPDLTAEGTRPAETQEAEETTPSVALETAPPAVEPAAEPAVPRILPPSTGEKVAAKPPRKQPRRRKPAATPPSDPGKAPESASSEAPGSGPEADRSEPATHHG